jgi:hypothetical protein
VVEEEREETIPARTVLLERLQETRPGPELASLLASIDRSSLDAAGLLRVARARQRLIAHQEARFLSDLHAVARAVPDHGSQPGRRDQPGKYPWAEEHFVGCELLQLSSGAFAWKSPPDCSMSLHRTPH